VEPVWTILTPTIGRRRLLFEGLAEVLVPQLGKAEGLVEWIAYYNNGWPSLGEIRQSLLTAATGEYVSFIDDDDMVPDDFVETILRALSDGYNPDVIGFKVRYTSNGQEGPECICSIGNDPGDGDGVMHRDLTHVQPVRTDLAQLGDFRRGWPEDNTWRRAVRPFIVKERFIDREMYYYRYNSGDTVQIGQGLMDFSPALERAEVPCGWFRYLDEGGR
jgi:hypothetical protein